MITTIRTKLVGILAAAALLVVPVMALTTVSASAQVNPQAGICQGANDLQFTSSTANDACDGLNDNAEIKVNDIVEDVINIFSVVVGIIAVIMIIIGGLKYITSGGDSGKVTSAKNSIIYAVIGLIIVALAQIIVRFVLAKTV